MALTDQEKRDFLARVELFAGVDPSHIGALADTLVEADFRAGAYIAIQGQVGTGLYIIASGHARAVMGDDVLAHFGPGDFFGELSVLDREPRMANVVADESTVTLALPSWDLFAILEREPKVAIAMLVELSRRLRALSEQQHRH